MSDFLGGLRRGEMAADHFTIVANAVARDPYLSYAAKGLFLNMASHRERFKITEEFLASQSTDGVKTIRRLLGELREAGYVYRSASRTRYPAGTRNAAGKDISGALGPYTWFVTDRPDEIAVILAQYATETVANATKDSAGGDNRPAGQAVPANAADPAATTEAQHAGSAGSADQGERGVSAGRHLRPVTTGGSGSSKEDHPKKTKKKTIGGASARPRTPAAREPLPRSGGGPVSELELAGDPPVARARDDRAWWGAGAWVVAQQPGDPAEVSGVEVAGMAAGIDRVPLSPGIPAVRMVGDRMISDHPQHWATLAPGEPDSGGWAVSWLPGKLVSRDQAITALTLSAIAWTHTLTCDNPWWPHIDTWAAELGLTGPDAVVRATEAPGLPGGAR